MTKYIRSIPQKYKDSFLEMKNLRSLVGISMLLAISVVLSFFTINLGENIKIGVGFVVTALLGMLYGPVAGAFAAGTGDLIKYLIKPTGPYFFGFTLTAMLGAVIYGMFFYQSRCTVAKAVTAKTSVTLLLNCLLNTFWIHLLYGSPFLALLFPRIVKNLLTLPFEIILLYLTLSTVPALLAHARPRVG